MKRICQLILSATGLVLVAAGSADAKGWRGLEPLRSTRLDVERILGISNDPCRCIYKTQSEVVTIFYARQSCSENSNGWNVPPDTVVTINVAPKDPPRFSDLIVDKQKFKRTKDLHTPAVYYYDPQEGIMYEVSEDGMVRLTVYSPSINDSKLRCTEAPKPEQSQFAPVFDQYGDISINDENARLDNFAAQLSHLSDSVGYIIVYPSRQKSSAKALNRAGRARSYLATARDIDRNRVRVITGGRRDRFTIELYILPKTQAAPRPDPSISGKSQ